MRLRGARRWWSLGAIALSLLAAGLDVTVLSVALPTLAGALKATESQLQWFSSGYALALAAAMLPAGLLGDRYGRKRVMLAALVLFAAGSIACAYSPSAEAFIVARIVLGLAAAAMTVMALSIITVIFSEEERPRAVGIWAAATFLALPIGPILGGWVLTNFWWGWVFLLNVPVALLGLIVVIAFIPESSAAQRPALDLLGVALSSIGLATVTFGLIEAGNHGWGDASAVLPLLGGLLVLVLFIVWEAQLTRRADGQPLVDLALFRSAAFTWGVLLAALGTMPMLGLLFTLPQYFQAIMGADAQGSGVRLLPVIAGVIVGAGPADRVAARVGPKLTVAIGFVVMAVGAAIGATGGVASSEGFIGAWTLVSGAGTGLALATAASAALVEVSAERSGMGASLMQAVQKLGAPFAVAILGSVLNAAYQSHVSVVGLPTPAAGAVKGSVFGGLAVAGQLHSSVLLASVRTAFVSGMDDVLRASALIAVAGVVLALVFLPRLTTAAARTTVFPEGVAHERPA